MGGCRCSFRSCTRGTDGVTHFFHFPVKDVARCLAWIKNCQRPEYSELKLTQLKNKVVCQYHFTDDMFLNYKHDRLIKRAVPTLEAIKHDRYEEVTMSISLSPIKNYTNYPKEKHIDLKTPFITMLQKYHSTPLVEGNVPSINLSETTLINSNSTIATNITAINKNKDNSDLADIKRTELIKEKIEAVETDPLNTQEQNENLSKPSVAQLENTQTTITPLVNRKKINIHSDIILPEKSRINFVNIKGRTISKYKPPFSKPIKKDKITNNLSLPSVLHTPELMISQTPVMKKSVLSNAALVNDQLRRVGRDKILKQRFIKVENKNNTDDKSVSKENTQENEYMKLILKTRDEMAEIKKILQEKSVQKPVEIVEEPRTNAKMSKEFLFTAIVPYLSAETAKKVHEEMFPSLAIR